MKYLLMGLLFCMPNLVSAQSLCRNAVENVFRYYGVPELGKDRAKLTQSGIAFDMEDFYETLPQFSLSKVPYSYNNTFYHSSIHGEIKAQQKVYQIKIEDTDLKTKAMGATFAAQYDQDSCKYKGLMMTAGKEMVLLDPSCKVIEGKSEKIARAESLCKVLKQEDSLISSGKPVRVPSQKSAPVKGTN